MTARLRVAHCPLHGPSWAPKWGRKALRLGADSIGFTEAYKAIGWLRRRPLYRCFTGSSTRKDARGRVVAHDVAVLVRRRHKIIAHGSFKGCDQITGSLKYHPERWVVWVIYRIGRGKNARLVLHVGLHPQAGIASHPDSKAGEQYAAEMHLVEELVEAQREAHGDDLLIVATGDMQAGKSFSRTWGPAKTFKRLGLAYVVDGINWIAYTSSLKPAAKAARVVPAGEHTNGQDHPWRAITLEAR